MNLFDVVPLQSRQAVRVPMVVFVVGAAISPGSMNRYIEGQLNDLQLLQAVPRQFRSHGRPHARDTATRLGRRRR